VSGTSCSRVRGARLKGSVALLSRWRCTVDLVGGGGTHTGMEEEGGAMRRGGGGQTTSKWLQQRCRSS
jgi:hypothetical protein